MRQEIAEMRKLAFSPPEDTSLGDQTYLEIEREAVVRARVVLDCAFIEEVTALIIMNHVLSKDPKWNQIEYFGRIKRYSIFYQDVLGHLTARHKIGVVKKFTRVPKDISKTLERMFALRDAFSHIYTFDFGNVRSLQYNGRNVATLDGFKPYIEDSTQVISFLMKARRVLWTLTSR